MQASFRLFLLLSICLCFGCTDNDQVHQLNITEIKEYIEINNLDAMETSSGLHYVISKEGDGTHPASNATVTVLYEGKYTDGVIFDTTYDDNESISFGLNEVIAGWTEGIPLLSRGGEGILLIPSELGYGSNPPGGVRSNAVLIFRVELLDY